MLSGSSVEPDSTNGQAINLKLWRQVNAGNLDLGSVSALLPPFWGVSERSERECGLSV